MGLAMEAKRFVLLVIFASFAVGQSLEAIGALGELPTCSVSRDLYISIRGVISANMSLRTDFVHVQCC